MEVMATCSSSIAAMGFSAGSFLPSDWKPVGPGPRLPFSPRSQRLHGAGPCSAWPLGWLRDAWGCGPIPEASNPRYRCRGCAFSLHPRLRIAHAGAGGTRTPASRAAAWSQLCRLTPNSATGLIGSPKSRGRKRIDHTYPNAYNPLASRLTAMELHPVWLWLGRGAPNPTFGLLARTICVEGRADRPRHPGVDPLLWARPRSE
jgi:hypothetical protein